MVTTVPGSEFLTSALNAISQGLQIPVVIFLLLFALFAILMLGGLVSEYTSRMKVSTDLIEKLVFNINNAPSIEDVKKIVEGAKIPKSQKLILMKVIRAQSLTKESREALARKLIESEENGFTKSLGRTDVITRIGPTLGLMGTLIPMGPGLAALGAGDINTLANSIIVAFDTTVVGIGSGAVAYVVAKIRRRWYEEYLSNLDVLVDCVLDKLNQG
ncbi:MotA/TolQ/ExbB proton channel family protein [Methanobrevibacter thaueri]|uniref:MotA/TolQ/ExbB proton channel family protein n=1 Tax=Methanobrevibacter thaueri TaxID=190975 RepID=A0A315XKQ7_9EURY|nr:MotA/TolQ/ExbB proton channel family protein [Methanobrevibacter thaueri]PWB84698.1 MotA/TolQ/ExbB proton channel family protein [Methanobrevibacter thaueri]